MNDAFSDASAKRQRSSEKDRAVRYALKIPLRYRISGNKKWVAGETINMSTSGVLFSAEELLELNTILEITFQASEPRLLASSTRRAEVVRRVLNSWPEETRPVFGAKFK